MAEGLYADSSALVKLVIDEAETWALRRLVASHEKIVTSRLAVVEVHRAVRMAHASPESEQRAQQLLESCQLMAVSDDLVEWARSLASSRLRSLDAIHLATALRVRAQQVVTYDRRLMEAAADEGLEVLHPGAAA